MRTKTAPRGFTMVEMLISLAITALLMVAMGGAFSAASSAVEMNDRFYRSLQQGRSAEDMIMTLIRRCADITAANSTSITLDAAAGDFQGHNLTITYNSSSGSITMTDNTAGTPATASMVLAANVSSATFTEQSGPTMTGTIQSNAVIGLTLTVQIGNNQVTLSNSAAPRVYSAALYN